jgi:hypothetical protein
MMTLSVRESNRTAWHAAGMPFWALVDVISVFGDFAHRGAHSSDVDGYEQLSLTKHCSS